MRVMVTGPDGLFGRALLSSIDDDLHEMVTLSRRSRPEANHEVVDLRYPEQVTGCISRVEPDVLVHLAGGFGENAVDLFERNALTTVNLLQAVARSGAPTRCIIVGSAAEYGNPLTDRIAEDHPLQPVNDYGRAKAAQSLLAHSISSLSGIPLVVIRPFNPVSPALKSAVALGNIKRQLLTAEGTKRKLVVGRTDVVRDFVPLSTIVEGLKLLIRGDQSGVTLNICSGSGIRLDDIITAMARLLEIEVHIERNPALTQIPAPERVVGDPSEMKRVLGLSVLITPQSIAELVLSDAGSTS